MIWIRKGSIKHTADFRQYCLFRYAPDQGRTFRERRYEMRRFMAMGLPISIWCTQLWHDARGGIYYAKDEDMQVRCETF